MDDPEAKLTAIMRLAKSLTTALRDNQEALPLLPEMMEHVIQVCHEEKTGAENVHSARGDEHKAILAMREKEQLKNKIESLQFDIRRKDERIDALNKTIVHQREHINAVDKHESGSFANEDSMRPLAKQVEYSAKFLKDRNDRLIAEIQNKDKGLTEHKEKISWLENELEGAKKDSVEKEAKISSLENELEVAKKDSVEKEAKNEEKMHEAAVADKLKEQANRYQITLSGKDKDIEDLRNSNADLTRTIEAKEEQIKEQAAKLGELERNSNDALTGKERQIEQMKSRIAFLSENRVKQDQSKVEDTLSNNRQSKLEEDFKNFVDEARVDATDVIQSFYHSEEEIYVRIYYPRLACMIFETAYERIKEAKGYFLEISKEVSRELIQTAPNMIYRYLSHEKRNYYYFDATFRVSMLRQQTPYPADVVDALLMNLKETAHDCNLEFYVVEVQTSVYGKWRKWYDEDKRCISLSQSLLNEPKIVSYIKKCIRLAWRMITQVPAMKIEYESTHLKDIHTFVGYHSSPTMYATGKGSKEEIACYLWPGLFDGGGRLIRAGDVVCKVAR